uniref:Nucleoporin NUP42 n=1 Tax=Strigamia maritima TaxID=126957 RepID=T1JD43_STRMM
MTMIPCKFYARGYCRNGNNCRFLHDGHENNQQNTPGNYRYIRSSVLSENRSQPIYSNTNRQDQEREIRQNVVQDVAAWEAGNQWLFSCFAPIKDGENFPELNDISPEELRWNAYQAEMQGTIHNYKEEVSNLASEMKHKRSMLKNPSHGVMETLVKIMNNSLEKEVLKSTSQQPNVFGSQAPSNSASSFSFKLPANRNALTANTTSLFGNQENIPNATSSSLFGGTPAGNFAAAGQSAFGGNQPVPSDGLFTQTQNVFPTQQQTNASTFSFSSGHLQNNPAPSNSFGSGPFQTTSTTQNMQQNFGFAANTQTNQSNSLFGRNNSSNSAFGVRGEEETTKYSKIENLTEEEKQQFLSPSFTLGLIPEKPPPREFV